VIPAFVYDIFYQRHVSLTEYFIARRGQYEYIRKMQHVCLLWHTI